MKDSTNADLKKLHEISVTIHDLKKAWKVLAKKVRHDTGWRIAELFFHYKLHDSEYKKRAIQALKQFSKK